MIKSRSASDVENEYLLRKIYDPAYVFHASFGDSPPPVQVCLDARMLGVDGTGVATYAAVLAQCLGDAGAAPLVLGEAPPSGATVVRRSRLRRWQAALHPGERRVEPVAERDTAGRVGPGLARADVFREAQVYFNLHQRLMPIVCEAPPKVMHWTYPVPLYVAGARNVYTVHDVIPLTRPELTPIRTARHRILLAQIARHASRIVTVSDAARGEIVDLLRVPADAVVSLDQAIHLPLQRDPLLPDGLRAGGYFLFCGTIEPRKNLLALAAAHAASGTTRPLVIVGPDGWRADRIRRALAAYPAVRLLPWQQRTTLIGLLRRARALMFPSLAEGFGLPIAEAMTLGTPVLTSRGGATEEVAGGAALLVDPGDPAGLAAGIARLDRDDVLARRLQTLGFARAGHFTIDRYTRRLRHFYAELVAADGAAAQPVETARG